MSIQQGYVRRRPHKLMKITLTNTSRGICFSSSSNNTSPIPPYRVDIKRKFVPEEKSNEELPAGIGDEYSFSPLFIDDDF